MLQFKKYYVMIPILLIAIVLIACSKKDSEVIVNSYIKTDSDSKTDGAMDIKSRLYTEKLSTSLATDKIKFVDKSNTQFWDAIKYNYIDTEYNKTKVVKDNIRIHRRANEVYANMWLEELEKTYNYLKKEVLVDNKKELENQYKSFLNYYNSSQALYMGILTPSNNYDAIIDGTDTIRQFYALADDVREYTILLKEYIFIETGEIEFYTNESIKNKTSNHLYKDASIESIIIDDEQFEDILIDNYDKKVRCSLKDKTEKSAHKKVGKYYNYWLDEVKQNYDNVAEIFNKNDRKILKNQRENYFRFLESSKMIQKDILDDSDVVHYKYKQDVYIENMIYESKGSIRYNTLLMEYYYLLTGKIDL